MTLFYSRPVLLSAFVAALSCGGEPDRFAVDATGSLHRAAYASGAPRVRMVGEVSTIIGNDSGPDPHVFGAVSGVARDEEGRVVVADRLADEVRVFDPDGRFLYKFGRSGAGPGEFRGPATPILAGDSVLWVRDTGNGRLAAWRLGTTAAELIRTIPSVSGGAILPFPIGVHPSGAIIDVRNRGDFSAGALIYTRHVLDSTGRTLAVQEIAPPTTDRVPSVSFSSGVRHQTGGLFYPAFGPRHLLAQARTGDWAEAVSSEYAVRWYDPDGQYRLTIARDAGPGPTLTPSERRVAAEAARLIKEKSGTSAPGGIPEHKPVLQELKFDRRGQLWVLRTGTRGEPAHADVFDSTGAYLAEVEWPASVALGRGDAGLDVSVGVLTARSGGERVAIVAFRPATASDTVPPAQH